MQKNYEVMYILRIYDDEAVEQVINRYQELIEVNEGKVLKVDRWGKKYLAYEIDDQKEGYYVLVTFTGIPKTFRALDAKLRIDEDVLRFIIMSKGE